MFIETNWKTILERSFRDAISRALVFRIVESLAPI